MCVLIVDNDENEIGSLKWVTQYMVVEKTLHQNKIKSYNYK